MVSLGAAAWLVALLVLVLVLVLALLSDHADSWLVGPTSWRVLWTVGVTVGGLAGWGYAATVVLAAGWSPTALVLLACTAGGLPFALVAAMLANPPRLARDALIATVALLVAGAVMTAWSGPGLLGVAARCVDNLAILLATPGPGAWPS